MKILVVFYSHNEKLKIGNFFESYDEYRKSPKAIENVKLNFWKKKTSFKNLALSKAILTLSTEIISVIEMI